jgi:hypothetical protein
MPTQRYRDKETVELILLLLTEKMEKRNVVVQLWWNQKNNYFPYLGTQSNRRKGVYTKVIKVCSVKEAEIAQNF